MKTVIQLVVVAVVVGGASAAITMFSQKSPPAPSVAAADADQAKPASGDSHDKDHPPADGVEAPPEQSAIDSEPKQGSIEDENPLAAADPPRNHSTEPPALHRPNGKESVVSEPVSPKPEARVGVRPPYTPEGDEAGGLINLLRERSRIATESERRLAERQDAMQLIFEDLRSEQALALKIRQRLSTELKQSRDAVDAALSDIASERNAIQKSQTAAKEAADAALKTVIDERDLLRKKLEQDTSPNSQAVAPPSTSPAGPPEDNTNLKRMAAVFDNMPVDSVAKVFEQLVKNKKTEAVVALMNAMKERQSAKVLGVLSETNAELAADLTDRLKRLKSSSEKSGSE